VQSADDVVMVIGPSDEAPATAPIVTSSGIPNFITAGNSRFDVNREPYLFRLTPSDTDLGAALGHFGFRAGSRAAAVFTNDLGAQTTVAPLRAAYKARERSLAADITVRLAQRSYRREVARLVEANPDVIITELDAATAGVFFKDLRRAVRTLPPILTTSRSNNAKWIGTMENAIGAAAVRRLVKFVGVGMAIGEPAHTEYSELLEHIDPQLGDPEQYVKQPWAMADYDAVIVTALAMSCAKSAEPSEYRRHIREVTGDPRGKAVQTYAEGLAALAKGRAIRYVGASGSLTFDENQSVRRGFTLLEHDRASGALAVAAAVEPDELAR
jgi:branched-chain amino acid transport system substrate-binding protein